jgi:hypothetical protein
VKYHSRKATPNLGVHERHQGDFGKHVSVCQVTRAIGIIPGDRSRYDTAECARKHRSGYVDSESLRLFFLLVPRRQNQQDAWCKACFEDPDQCPQGDQLTVCLDYCHAASRSALPMSAKATRSMQCGDLHTQRNMIVGRKIEGLVRARIRLLGTSKTTY